MNKRLSEACQSITLDIYSHEFAAVQHRDSVASKLTSAFAGILGETP